MLVVLAYLLVSQIGFAEGIFNSGINYAYLTGVIKEKTGLPKHLFDIKFNVENPLVSSAKNLILKVSFENFGTKSTPIKMTFIIQDENKKQVYLSQNSIVVETESIFLKTFQNSDFGPGKYTVYLRTLYNGNVEDIFSKKFEISNNISKSKNQLFDITFNLDKKIVEKIGDLTARVSFESFGTEPTPVNMVFTFLDANGKKVYSEENNTIVETEKVLTKKFSYLNLEKGNYTLVLTTNYNTNVKDEFREKFTITGAKSYEWVNWVSFALNFLFLFAVVFLFRRSSFVKKMKK